MYKKQMTLQRYLCLAALILNAALLVFTVYFFIQVLHDPELHEEPGL